MYVVYCFFVSVLQDDMMILVMSVESFAALKEFQIQDKPLVSVICVVEVVPSFSGVVSGLETVLKSMNGGKVAEELVETRFGLSKQVLSIFRLPHPG